MNSVSGVLKGRGAQVVGGMSLGRGCAYEERTRKECEVNKDDVEVEEQRVTSIV
jgi:hypothetical protein